MRLLLFICFSLLLAMPGQAQERVRNIRIRVADSSQLEIRYDLINTRPGDSVYFEVRSRLRGLLRILPEFVRGDVNTGVVAGSDRRIIWNALANGYSLNEEIRATVLVKTATIVAFSPAEPIATTQPVTNPAPPAVADQPRKADDVAVKPVPAETRPTLSNPPAPVNQSPPRSSDPLLQPKTTTVPQAEPERVSIDPGTSSRTRYAGPAWALLSVIAPGVGNIFVQTPKPRIGFRPLVTVGFYGLLVYGLQERQKSRDVYAVYEAQKNAEAGAPFYQTANGHHHRYFLATRGALVVAAADVILTFFKGIRNGKEQVANGSPQSVTLRPGLQAGQPTAVLRYSF